MRDVTGPEDPDGPLRAGPGAVMRLEIEFHRAAAGHADVRFQGPVDQVWSVHAIDEHFLGEGQGLGLQLAAPDRAGVQAGGRHEHLGAGVLRGAAERVGEDDEHEGRALVFEGGQLLVKRGGGFRHFVNRGPKLQVPTSKLQRNTNQQAIN